MPAVNEDHCTLRSTSERTMGFHGTFTEHLLQLKRVEVLGGDLTAVNATPLGSIAERARPEGDGQGRDEYQPLDGEKKWFVGQGGQVTDEQKTELTAQENGQSADSQLQCHAPQRCTVGRAARIEDHHWNDGPDQLSHQTEEWKQVDIERRHGLSLVLNDMS